MNARKISNIITLLLFGLVIWGILTMLAKMGMPVW